MIINISFLDRISISQICPANDSIDRLIIRRELLEKVKITGAESEALNLRSETGDKGVSYKWDNKDALLMIKDIDFTDGEVTYLRSILQKLSEKKELHATQIDLYQKFFK